MARLLAWLQFPLQIAAPVKSNMLRARLLRLLQCNPTKDLFLNEMLDLWIFIAPEPSLSPSSLLVSFSKWTFVSDSLEFHPFAVGIVILHRFTLGGIFFLSCVGSEASVLWAPRSYRFGQSYNRPFSKCLAWLLHIFFLWLFCTRSLQAQVSLHGNHAIGTFVIPAVRLVFSQCGGNYHILNTAYTPFHSGLCWLVPPKQTQAHSY